MQSQGNVRSFQPCPPAAHSKSGDSRHLFFKVDDDYFSFTTNPDDLLVFQVIEVLDRLLREATGFDDVANDVTD